MKGSGIMNGVFCISDCCSGSQFQSSDVDECLKTVKTLLSESEGNLRVSFCDSDEDFTDPDYDEVVITEEDNGAYDKAYNFIMFHTCKLMTESEVKTLFNKDTDRKLRAFLKKIGFDTEQCKYLAKLADRVQEEFVDYRTGTINSCSGEEIFDMSIKTAYYEYVSTSIYSAIKGSDVIMAKYTDHLWLGGYYFPIDSVKKLLKVKGCLLDAIYNKAFTEGITDAVSFSEVVNMMC